MQLRVVIAPFTAPTFVGGTAHIPAQLHPMGYQELAVAIHIHLDLPAGIVASGWAHSVQTVAIGHSRGKVSERTHHRGSAGNKD